MYDSCLFDCREKGVSVSASPSPTEELEEDMPASSELASILKTLKRVEQNVKCKSANTFSHIKFVFWLYCSIGLKKWLALDMCLEGHTHAVNTKNLKPY